MQDWYHQLGVLLNGDPFGLFLEYVGAFAGAVSGIRLASVKKFDWFGAYVIGCVTALGGGTLRDIILNVPPFWMLRPDHLIVTVVALIMISLFGRRFISETITWFVFDTISIALFTVFGLEKTLQLGYAWWAAVIMGVVTAVFGGILRDISINEVPLIFRRELYAMACVSGALVYIILKFCGCGQRVCSITCIMLIFLLRALAIHFKWHVPVLTGRSHVHVHFDLHSHHEANHQNVHHNGGNHK